MNCNVSGGAKCRHGTSFSNRFVFGLVLCYIGVFRTRVGTLGSALVLRSDLFAGAVILRGFSLLLCCCGANVPVIVFRNSSISGTLGSVLGVLCW